MPLNLVFVSPGTYTIEDNGVPGDNTSVIRDGNGTVVHTFVHPADSLSFTVNSPGVHIKVNLTDSLGAANLTIGSLTSAAASPDSISVGNVRTTGIVTLVSNGAISELGNDGGTDIVAGQLILSAATGIGAGNALETQVSSLEAETNTGGITLRNFGAVQIGGLSDHVDGLHVGTSGSINLSNVGSIFLSDLTGTETVRGGTTSGNVTLIASGADADIIASSDQDAITAPGGSIVLNAGRDIGFGIIGANYDNDVRARGSITIDAGRDFLVDGFSDIASDDFGGNTGGNLFVTTGRNIHIRNVNGTDGSLAAGGTAGADLILTTGPGGAVILDAPSAAALLSSSGDVIVNADRMLIAAASGITANGAVYLRAATLGREFILGSGSDGAFAVELSDAELDRIFTSNLFIGAANGGNVTVSAAISSTIQNVTLLSAEDLWINASFATTNSLTLRAGNNLYHTGGTISTVTLAAFVDTLGNDGGVGGIGLLSGVTGTTVTLDGGAENDTLRGAEGINQIVRGNGGNDRLISSGEGRYLGGAGNDVILAGLSSGLVPEVLNGGAGVDTVDTSNFGGSYVINLTTGVTNFNFESFLGFENAITGDGADQVTGTAGNNVIHGNNGVDALNGGGGNDSLFGGAGPDRLIGGLGNDRLHGGADTDRLEGGGGNDTYVLESGADVVVDTGGIDTVTSTITRSLVGLPTIERLTLAGAAAINGTGNALNNTLTGNTAANLLAGGGGNDTLNGMAGSDTYTGGAGNDLFRFTNTAHSPNTAQRDVIKDFDDSGDDRIDVSALFGPAMTYRHNLAFSAAGQVRVLDIAGPDVIVQVNTGGTLAADFSILLKNTTLASMTVTDFVL